MAKTYKLDDNPGPPKPGLSATTQLQRRLIPFLGGAAIVLTVVIVILSSALAQRAHAVRLAQIAAASSVSKPVQASNRDAPPAGLSKAERGRWWAARNREKRRRAREAENQRQAQVAAERARWEALDFQRQQQARVANQAARSSGARRSNQKPSPRNSGTLPPTDAFYRNFAQAQQQAAQRAAVRQAQQQAQQQAAFREQSQAAQAQLEGLRARIAQADADGSTWIDRANLLRLRADTSSDVSMKLASLREARQYLQRALGAFDVRDRSRYELGQFYLQYGDRPAAIELFRLVERSQSGATQLGASARQQLVNLGVW